MSYPTGQGVAANTVLVWDGTKWTSQAYPTSFVTSVTSSDTNVITATPTTGAVILDAPNILITGGAVAMGLGIPFAAVASGGNTAIGQSAGAALAGGSLNTFYGQSAGSNTTTGQRNTYIGSQAGLGGAAGTRSQNTAIGQNAGSGLTDNVTVGYNAGLALAAAISNVLIGKAAGSTVSTGSNNVMIGSDAGNLSSSTAEACVYIGSSAGAGTGDFNVAIGPDAASSMTTGNQNVYIGNGVAISETTGLDNVVIGSDAMSTSATSNRCVVIGRSALSNGDTADGMVVIGNQAAQNPSAAAGLASAVIIGSQAAFNATLVLSGVFIGLQAGYQGGGIGNIAIGSQALSGAYTGNGNIAMGSQVASTFTSGDNNIFMGFQAAAVFGTGNGNILLNVTGGVNSGDSNVFINGSAGAATGSSNIVIGVDPGNIPGPAVSIGSGNGNIIIAALPLVANGNFTMNLGGYIQAIPGQVSLAPPNQGSILTQTHSTGVYATADTNAPFGMTTAGANGATTRQFTGNRTPVGNVTGNPGDLYIRSSTTTSDVYLHNGAVSNNTNWVSLTATTAPAAPSGSVQFNNAGVFGGSANATLTAGGVMTLAEILITESAAPPTAPGAAQGTFWVFNNGADPNMPYFTGGSGTSYQLERMYTVAVAAGAYAALNDGSHHQVLAVNFAGAVAVTLPATPVTNAKFTIKDASGLANVNNITINGNGNNIDGVASQVIATIFGALEIIFNGTVWLVIG